MHEDKIMKRCKAFCVLKALHLFDLTETVQMLPERLHFRYTETAVTGRDISV